MDDFMNSEKGTREFNRVERIQYMEAIFDEARSILDAAPSHDSDDVEDSANSFALYAAIKPLISELIEYYESGLWMEDYEADERGEIPSSLKRGVLSQDGIYNLIFEAREIEETLAEDEKLADQEE